MGTNFYKIKPKKVKQEKIKEIKESFDNILKTLENGNNIRSYTINDLLDKLQEQKVEKIHLGKRSGGWQFLWNHNNKQYYQDNLESIKEFLNDGDGWIEDEYGEIFTPEQFLNDEIGYCLYNDPEKYINGYQYDKQENHHYSWQTCGHYEYTASDGLRFSTSTEFC